MNKRLPSFGLKHYQKIIYLRAPGGQERSDCQAVPRVASIAVLPHGFVRGCERSARSPRQHEQRGPYVSGHGGRSEMSRDANQIVVGAAQLDAQPVVACAAM